MNDWISLLMMMLSAAEMALFSERMLFSSLFLPRLCACALLLALLQLLPLPLCLLMTPLLFVLTQLLNSRLMLSEILFPCTLYGLILNIQAMLPFQALSSVVLLLPLLLLISRLQKLYKIFQQEKAASLLLTLIAYAQLLGASLLSLHDAFDLQLFLLVLCVMFTICADTLLLPLLHAIFLSLQEEHRLRHMKSSCSGACTTRVTDTSCAACVMTSSTSSRRSPRPKKERRTPMKNERPYLLLYGMLLSQLLLFALLCAKMILKVPLAGWLSLMALSLELFLILRLLALFRERLSQKEKNRSVRQRQAIEEEYLRGHEGTAASLDMIRAEIETQIENFPELAVQSPLQRNIIIAQLLEEYSRLCSMELCANDLVDAVIFNKKTRAGALGIHMSCALALPASIPVSPIDLISVFTNLLDNAIEGCMMMPPEQRVITLSAQIRADCLIVTTANPKPSSLHLRTEGMRSAKGEGHGLGLSILQQIADRYEGSFTCEDSGESVEFSIMLLLDTAR